MSSQIANAGINESSRLVGADVELDERGTPAKPNILTLQVNIIAVAYSKGLSNQYCFTLVILYNDTFRQRLISQFTTSAKTLGKDR